MVANLGVSWELPDFWPAYVASMDFELFGREGAISVKDDHRDVLMASRKPIHSPYTPDTTSMNVAMLGSYMPGDWALGEHFGAMQEETHAFINAVGTGPGGSRSWPPARTGWTCSTSHGQSTSRLASGEVVAIDWGQ